MSLDTAISQLRQRPLTLTALAVARRVCIEHGIRPADIDLAMVFLEQGNQKLALQYIMGPSPRTPSPGAIAILEAIKRSAVE